jgi:hypothetical protein
MSYAEISRFELCLMGIIPLVKVVFPLFILIKFLFRNISLFYYLKHLLVSDHININFY